MVSFSFVQHVPGALPCVSGLRRNAQCLKHPLLEPLGQSGVNVGGGGCDALLCSLETQEQRKERVLFAAPERTQGSWPVQRLGL